MGRSIEGKMEVSGGPVRDRSASDILTASMDVASAVQHNPATPELPPKEVWRVTKECSVVLGGVKQKFYEGKEIDTLNYDIKALRRQGVKLERVVEEQQ